MKIISGRISRINEEEFNYSFTGPFSEDSAFVSHKKKRKFTPTERSTLL